MLSIIERICRCFLGSIDIGEDIRKGINLVVTNDKLSDTLFVML